MHLHFERIQKPSSFSDCNLSSLTWMGKVPEGLLQVDDEGWKLNRSNYYQDGWLATGNTRGIVGVTYTTCRCRKSVANDLPPRTNYNLRGHRSELTLVKWNEPYQKLASCDSSGIIFVWIKYEGRWSIELINDRSTQVTDFSWSHDGRMALICYMDGFVLVGSVSGQRYWSSMLNLESCTISCGIWSPDDQQVIFGTSSGHILVIDVHGTMVAQVSIQDGIAITSMTWSCEKFKMEDSDEEQREQQPQNDSRTFALAVSFSDGTVFIMRNYDDIFPIIIRTGMLSLKMEWSNSGEVIAIAGHKIKNMTIDANGNRTFSYLNIVQFYSIGGTLRFTTIIDFTQHPITALTWGHSDKRLFVATGPVLHIAWITKRVASLQLLSKLAVYGCLAAEDSADELPLPPRLRNTISSLFGQTLQCYLPDLQHLREFVSCPPRGNIRLHCTMIRHDDDLVNGTTSYVLYLEYLGGLVPILKGKRASKIRPEFIIFDPQETQNHNKSKFSNSALVQSGSPSSNFYNRSNTPYTTSSDSELDDGCNTSSPSVKRKRRFRSRHFRSRSNESSSSTSSNSSGSGNAKRDNVYICEMPESEKLVLVTSNIWGTKFKILGLSSWLPSQLGTITYRTSLLHLQPRQMTLAIKELGGSRASTSFFPIEKYDNNNFMSSDSEDEVALGGVYDEDLSVPIAPMTPKKCIRGANQGNTISPERRPTIQFRTMSSNANSNNDYVNFVPNMNEDLLTLQINGDSHYLSMEINSQPGINTMSSSISTQTSFQSISELINSLSVEKNTQTTFSPLIEMKTLEEQTEETFNLIAKRFASDLPCNNCNTSSFHYNSTKCESMHSPALINIANSSTSDASYYHQLTSSGQSMSPNVSPPKGIRYKITKKESPRKASISCIEPDLAPGRSCDSSSIFTCSPKSQRRCANGFVASPSSNASTWGGVSVLHCTTNNIMETLTIDSKSSVANDFKFIDDFEGEDPTELQHTRSPSVMFQKNRTICHMQPTIGSEFTNIRTGSDSISGHSLSNQSLKRRLTLRASKQSHSFEMNDVNHYNTDNSRNCLSLDEEEECKDGSTCPCSEEKDNIITNNFEEIPPTEKKVCYKADIHSPPPPSTFHTDHNPSIPKCHKKKAYNFDNNNTTTLSDGLPFIPSRSSRLKSSMATLTLKDQSTDMPESSFSPRIHQHRGSLPQTISGANSINSTLATSATHAASTHNRSLPASPLLGHQRRRKAQGKGLLYSPMMLRKIMKQKLNYLDCSSDDDNSSDEESRTQPDFNNLESLQRANIRKKFKMKRRGSKIQPEDETSANNNQTVSYREFILHNKAPLWNEVSQVYQLDFGGRVTQESAKNFQIEHQGRQVMQFGRIDGNAYTLDFQYPFSALQALAVALANVTQRLK